MYILSSEQIRQWDRFTMVSEPIAAIDLMERAATTCLNWLGDNLILERQIILFCGKGNNGGDGLALARMLVKMHREVAVYVVETGSDGSEDFKINLARLKDTGIVVNAIHTVEDFPTLSSGCLIIDALFGTGLNRALQNLAASLIKHINSANSEVVSLDIPSGMFADKSSANNIIINAAHTLTFQCYKLAFLLPENERYSGSVHILDIGLHKDFVKGILPEFQLTDRGIVGSLFKSRKAFAHKGDFGHALIVAGSYGKIGAAVLSAKAVLRAGAGLLTCYIPSCGYQVMQTSVPEAMVVTDPHDRMISSINFDVTRYNAIGIGPGLGTEKETVEALKQLLSAYNKPLVLDADGLNIVAYNPELAGHIPPDSIISPHPKEFERLFGSSANDYERLSLARRKSQELQLVIILKGHYSVICLPDGGCYFNTTGNAGMATGGSGDVLTGILTSLLAQGYPSRHAALLGVYLHGLAGDYAAGNLSQEAMIASDITDNLAKAFKEIQSGRNSF